MYTHTHTPTSCLTMSPRERMNILWECLALINVLGAVAGSAQSADCTRLRCAIRGYSNICKLHTHLQIAKIQQKRAGHLMKIVCISSLDRTFKTTIGIFTGTNSNYPIVSLTSLNNIILFIITSNTCFKITFCCQRVHFNTKPR